LVVKEYFEKRLNRLLLEYMQRSGYYKSAELFTELNDLQAFSDDYVYTESASIVRDLEQNHSCASALAWCNTNKTKLAKIGSQMEFKLRVQEFLHLLNTKNDSMEALFYARKHLVKYSDEKENSDALQRETVIQVIGLLGYPQHIRTELPVFQQLYGNSNFDVQTKWSELAYDFKKECFSFYGLSPEP
jgi:macrophage erythroblast attacher